MVFTRVAALSVAAFALGAWAVADTITLTNGHVIEADRAWVEGKEVKYEKDGGVYGVPRTLVRRLDEHPAPTATTDPDVRRAREMLAAADPAEAVRATTLALQRDPASVPALQTMAEARLALGDAFAARQAAEKALRIDNRSARSWDLLGDAMAGLGDRTSAEAHWRKSLLLRKDPAVEAKLGAAGVAALRSESAPPPRALAAPEFPEAQFRLRYDGGLNEPLGKAVLDALTKAYGEYTVLFGFHPDTPVTVVLQMTTSGISDSRAPEWADGWNDGAIRVPVQGLTQPTPRLLRVLRHELAHSFVTSRTGDNCPTWLQEGIAQWLEGGDPARDDAALAAVARTGRVRRLLTIEGPFGRLREDEANVVYAQSLSAVAHILRKTGEAGLIRLISALADHRPPEEAMPMALALSYPEFQRSWEDYLRAADRAPTKPVASAR